VERVTRIELALSAWEADVLPLNYTRAPYRAQHDDWIPAVKSCPRDLPAYGTGSDG
jgi:hypothetical protein